MAVTDYIITDLDLNGKRVTDQEDVLVGNPTENKQAFDNYADVIRNKYNQLVGYMAENPISIDDIYPVGSIIASSVQVTPPFGGTWKEVEGLQIALTLNGGTNTAMHFYQRVL